MAADIKNKLERLLLLRVWLISAGHDDYDDKLDRDIDALSAAVFVEGMTTHLVAKTFVVEAVATEAVVAEAVVAEAVLAEAVVAEAVFADVVVAEAVATEAVVAEAVVADRLAVAPAAVPPPPRDGLPAAVLRGWLRASGAKHHNPHLRAKCPW